MNKKDLEKKIEQLEKLIEQQQAFISQLLSQPPTHVVQEPSIYPWTQPPYPSYPWITCGPQSHTVDGPVYIPSVFSKIDMEDPKTKSYLEEIKKLSSGTSHSHGDINPPSPHSHTAPILEVKQLDKSHPLHPDYKVTLNGVPVYTGPKYK